MTKEEFIEQFIVTFMATWAANEYPSSKYSWCEPPVVDAYFLAKKAWEHKQEVLGD